MTSQEGKGVCVCEWGCVRVCVRGCLCVWVCAQLRLTLCDPMDYNPPGSSVHGIFQARILEWVAISVGLPRWLRCKESTCQTLVQTPESGRSPVGENGNPLQYSFLSIGSQRVRHDSARARAHTHTHIQCISSSWAVLSASEILMDMSMWLSTAPSLYAAVMIFSQVLPVGHG